MFSHTLSTTVPQGGSGGDVLASTSPFEQAGRR
jgi:hypothetical protein